VFGDNIKEPPEVIFVWQRTVGTGSIRKGDRKIVVNASEKRERVLKEVPQMWACLAKR